jgi:hypothetical protein
MLVGHAFIEQAGLLVLFDFLARIFGHVVAHLGKIFVDLVSAGEGAAQNE